MTIHLSCLPGITRPNWVLIRAVSIVLWFLLGALLPAEVKAINVMIT